MRLPLSSFTGKVFTMFELPSHRNVSITYKKGVKKNFDAIRYSIGDQDAFSQLWKYDDMREEWRPYTHMTRWVCLQSLAQTVKLTMNNRYKDIEEVTFTPHDHPSTIRELRLKAVRTDHHVTDLGIRTTGEPALIYARKVLAGMSKRIKHVTAVVTDKHGNKAHFNAYRDFDRSSHMLFIDKFGNRVSRHDIGGIVG